MNALSRLVNYHFELFTTDEGHIMTIPLASDVMSRVYGSVRSQAESIVVQMGCGVRCSVLDADNVRSKMKEGGYRLKFPDVSPGGESHSILEHVLEYKRWQDEVHVRASRMGSSGPSSRRQTPPTDRQVRKDPRSDKMKSKDEGKKRPDEGIKPTVPRAGGGTDPAKPSPSPREVCL